MKMEKTKVEKEIDGLMKARADYAKENAQKERNMVADKKKEADKTKVDSVLSQVVDMLRHTTGGDVSEAEMKRRLRQDFKNVSALFSRDQARYLVDTYYQVQQVRINTAGYARSLKDGLPPEPAIFPEYISDNLHLLEDAIKGALGNFAAQYRVGQWLQAICGIGPVLSAGFLATFDPRHQPIDPTCAESIEKGYTHRPSTAGAWWRYAGLDPTVEWKKGKKRPFDARAKVLCWKVGESFIKVQNKDSDIYGKIFVARKALEIDRNSRSEFAGQAEAKLEKFKIGKTTNAYAKYSTGFLPDAHINARARRYAVKMFLSHFFDTAYRDYYNREPAVPFILSQDRKGAPHTHYIQPPPCNYSGRTLFDLWGSEMTWEEKFAKQKQRKKERDE